MEIDGAATLRGYARAIDVSCALERDRSGSLLAKTSTEGLLSYSVVDGIICTFGVAIHEPDVRGIKMSLQ